MGVVNCRKCPSDCISHLVINWGVAALFWGTAGSAAKQAWRKQQVRAWKLQQQREQEEQQRRRQEEEEERRKREEEIRKIRDLSNQDEQYNRFMKLVGGKHHLRNKVRGCK